MRVLKFRFSYIYESVWADAEGIELDPNHKKRGEELCEFVQNLWDPIEEKVFKLFEEIYQVKIHEEEIRAWFSLIAPIPFSDPLTITLKKRS